MENSQLPSDKISELIKHIGQVLISINVNITSFTGDLSGQDVKLDRLRRLSLAYCNGINQQGVQNILSITGDDLIKLDLSGTSISDLELVNIGVKLDKLQILKLEDCWHLTDQGLSELLCITNGSLEHLHLFRTNITCEGLTRLNIKLMALQTLDLNNCRKLTDQGLHETVGLTSGNLNELNLSGTDITAEGLARLAIKLDCIKILKLDGCRELDNHSFLEILNISAKSLKVLDISRTNVTCEELSELDIKLKDLQKLNLDSCKSLTNQRIMEILHITGENLRELNLSRTNITGEELLDARMPKLEILKMDGCKNLTDEMLLKILNITGETLRDLDLSRTKITCEAFFHLNIGLKLEILRLDGCRNLKEDWLILTLKNAGENLVTLDLSRTLITGERFSGLKIQLVKLVSLNLSYCRSLTLQGLQGILDIAGHHLEEIILDGTQLSRSLILDWLKDHNPEFKDITEEEIERIRAIRRGNVTYSLQS